MRFRILALLLLVAPPAPAGEGQRPLVFFREPDPASARAILENVKKLRAGTRVERKKRREDLIEYGYWAVEPYLVQVLSGKKASADHLVRMGAAICLGGIGDSRGLPALRVAVSDRDSWVRRTALLVLGERASPADHKLFRDALLDKNPNLRHQAAAAFALAKLPAHVRAADDLLVYASRKKAGDKHTTAAALLGVAVATPEAARVRAAVEPFLSSNDKLLSRTAAICLQLRPDAAPSQETLKRVLKRSRDGVFRAHLHLAVARQARTPEIRELLLEAAVRDDKREARIAALVGLADAWGEAAVYDRLKPRLGSARSNAEEEAALLYAMARSGNPDALGQILRRLQGKQDQTHYAIGNLGHLLYLRPGNRRLEREQEIFDKLTSMGDVRRPSTRRLLSVVLDLRGEKDAEKRRSRMRETFRETGLDGDPGLWSYNLKQRALADLNRWIWSEIFELDDIAETGGVQKRTGNGTEYAIVAEEVDLFDYLKPGYFNEEDLRGS